MMPFFSRHHKFTVAYGHTMDVDIWSYLKPKKREIHVALKTKDGEDIQIVFTVPR